jgi:hypothetical protein
VKWKSLILVVSFLAFSESAFAGAAFQFAAPGVRAPDDPNVNGLRFSVIHGSNQTIRGADFGLVSLSETGDLFGFSAVLGMGRLSGNMTGCATGLVNVHTGIDTGVNVGAVNRINTLKNGANIAMVNIADGFTRVDVGGLNVSESSTVQVGFLNVTKRIDAVQIGFLNVAENGFLPVFPFFNFPKN